MNFTKVNEREEELKKEVVILKQKEVTPEVLNIIALRRARINEIQKIKKLLK